MEKKDESPIEVVVGNKDVEFVATVDELDIEPVVLNSGVLVDDVATSEFSIDEADKIPTVSNLEKLLLETFLMVVEDKADVVLDLKKEVDVSTVLEIAILFTTLVEDNTRSE